MNADSLSTPTGWMRVTLSELAEPSKEKLEPAFFEGSRYVGLEHIDARSGRITGHGLGADVKSTKSVFRAGDVLYGKLRPYLKKVCIPSFDGVCSTDILVYGPSEYLDSRFFMRFLLMDSTANFAVRNSKGINLPRISAKNLGKITIPTPPLAEQGRIVAAIEALEERSARAGSLLAEVAALVDQLRQSVLHSAFNGSLTADWREANPDVEPARDLLARIRADRREQFEQMEEERFNAIGARPNSDRWKKRLKDPLGPDLSHGVPVVPPSWEIVSVSEVSHCLDFARVPVNRAERDRRKGPFPYFGANGVVGSIDEFLFHEELILVTEDETFYGRSKPIAYKITEPCWVNNHAHVLRVVRPIPSDFLLMGLMHYRVIPWLSGTTGRAKLTQAAMNGLPIGLPPLAEIDEITSRARAALEIIDRLEAALASHELDLSQLDQAILTKAFQGKLVPQDPNDEPAAELLARIACGD